MKLGILSALLQPANISLEEEALRIVYGAFKSTAAAAALQRVGRCIRVLAYIARKRSELQKAQAIKHCLFVGQTYDQSTGLEISCFKLFR